MKTIRIFGRSDSKKCNEAIRGLILKRINFKLYNIETDKDAYNEFLIIAGHNAEVPCIIYCLIPEHPSYLMAFISYLIIDADKICTYVRRQLPIQQSYYTSYFYYICLLLKFKSLFQIIFYNAFDVCFKFLIFR